MELLGRPLIIQNTDGTDWLVTWDEAVRTSDGESVSFTVAVPRDGDVPISRVQKEALLRAVELLQIALKGK